MKKFLYVAFVLVLLLPSFWESEALEEQNKSDFHTSSLGKLTKNIFEACDLVEEGKILYKKGDCHLAKEKFQEALDKDPENNSSKEYLQLCLQEEKRKELEAAHCKKQWDQLEKIETQHKKREQQKALLSFLAGGRQFYRNNNYTNAKIQFQQALSLDPENRQATKYLALCVRAEEKIEKLRKKLEQELEKEHLNQKLERDYGYSKQEPTRWEENLTIIKRLEKKVEQLEAEKISQDSLNSGAADSVVETRQCLASTDYDKSLLEEKSLLNDEKEEAKLRETEILLTQGNSCYDHGNYEQAYESYKKALLALQE
ncbi:MAG: tetratricopeptide repeat protein [Candidatus Omnitrophota bacterium]